MKAICVTSHKGGVGKTTIAVGLAALLAEDFDAKVCLVEADIFGPGLATAFSVDRPAMYLNEFLLLKDRSEARTVSAADLVVSLPIEMRSVKTVLAGIEPNLKQQTISRVQDLDVEQTYKWICALCEKLEDLDQEYLIVDNAPGIAGLQLAFQWYTFNTNGLNVFVSTPDRPALIGLLVDMGASSAVLDEWRLEKCSLVMNRVWPEQLNHYDSVEGLCDWVQGDRYFGDILSSHMREDFPGRRFGYSRLVLRWLREMTYHFVEYDAQLAAEQFAFGSTGRPPVNLYRRSRLDTLARSLVDDSGQSRAR